MSTTIKYPRTPHLPWSPGASSDDLRIIDTTHFINKIVIVTEKMDGENTSLYSDSSHARSLDSRHHPSRDWLKQWHSTMAHEIPIGWRICGENLYAQHSISYQALRSYFYGFSLWNEDNICLSWDETQTWFKRFNIQTPTVLYQGQWQEETIRRLRIDPQSVEGYVVRLADSFTYPQFAHSIAKWVRKNHVQTQQHWMQAKLTPNGLHSPLNDHAQ